MESIPQMPGQPSPAESAAAANVAVVTNADVEPRAAAGAPALPLRPDVRRVVVAVHGVGDQYTYATIQSVVNRFCGFYGQPAAVPLGNFHIDDATFSVEDPPYPTPFASRLAFAEVYWATIPRELVDEKHTLEESKQWARTIVERLRMRRREEGAGGDARVDFALLNEVLGEMIQTLAVADRICLLADKAGVFTFDLRQLLDDYLGDVQVVTEFTRHREKILAAFDEKLRKAAESCPNAEIHIVAHSEGTVVALLALLAAFRAPAPHPWRDRVRGLMTLGSPIDKHLTLWPRLFLPPGHPKGTAAPPAAEPPAPIRWRNYYDFGDPIGFALDDARRWIRAHGWERVFDFRCDDQVRHDHGFSRYPFPGKAHVDYWGDEELFGHFIEEVVTPGAGHAELPKAARAFPKPPGSIWWKQALSYVVPYVGVSAVLLLAAYVIFKAVSGAVYPEVPGEPSAAPGFSTTARWVFAIGALLAGTTVLARIPRLTRSAVGWVAAVVAGAASAALYVRLAGGFGDSVALMTAGAGLGLGLVAGTFRWRVRTLMTVGSFAAAAAVAVNFDALRRAAPGPAGPLWPVALATVAFLYLWWLGTLLFDLVFVWHHFIRHSKIRERVHEIIGDTPDVARDGAPPVTLPPGAGPLPTARRSSGESVGTTAS